MTTKNKFTESLFERLKDSYYKDTSNTGSYLKLTPGHTYTIRLVPNLDDIGNSSFPYFKHAFRSVSSGQFVNFMCPSTLGDPCPFCTKRFELWDKFKETNDERYKKMTDPIRRTDRRLVNVYIVDDPSNPKNNGTVKIMEFGNSSKSTIANCIDQALNGMMKDEQGIRIFDLSPNGMNMQIQVTKNAGNFNEYVAMFKSASALPNVDDLDSIYDKVIDLPSIPTVKTFDEIKHILETDTGVVEPAVVKPSAPAPTPTPTPEVAPVYTPTPEADRVVSTQVDTGVNDEMLAAINQYIEN